MEFDPCIIYAFHKIATPTATAQPNVTFTFTYLQQHQHDVQATLMRLLKVLRSRQRGTFLQSFIALAGSGSGSEEDHSSFIVAFEALFECCFHQFTVAKTRDQDQHIDLPKLLLLCMQNLQFLLTQKEVQQYAVIPSESARKSTLFDQLLQLVPILLQSDTQQTITCAYPEIDSTTLATLLKSTYYCLAHCVVSNQSTSEYILQHYGTVGKLDPLFAAEENRIHLNNNQQLHDIDSTFWETLRGFLMFFYTLIKTANSESSEIYMSSRHGLTCLHFCTNFYQFIQLISHAKPGTSQEQKSTFSNGSSDAARIESTNDDDGDEDEEVPEEWEECMFYIHLLVSHFVTSNSTMIKLYYDLLSEISPSAVDRSARALPFLHCLIGSVIASAEKATDVSNLFTDSLFGNVGWCLTWLKQHINNLEPSSESPSERFDTRDWRTLDSQSDQLSDLNFGFLCDNESLTLFELLLTFISEVSTIPEKFVEFLYQENFHILVCSYLHSSDSCPGAKKGEKPKANGLNSLASSSTANKDTAFETSENSLIPYGYQTVLLNILSHLLTSSSLFIQSNYIFYSLCNHLHIHERQPLTQQYSIVGLRILLQVPKFSTIWSEMKLLDIENKELWNREGINLTLDEEKQRVRIGNTSTVPPSTDRKPPKQGPWSNISTLDDLEDDFM